MNVTAIAAALRALADAIDADAVSPPQNAETLELFSVSDVAAHFQRAESTVRGWIAAGRFPGSFKLSDRDWRVPRSALTAFGEAQRRGKTANLGAWRKLGRLR